MTIGIFLLRASIDTDTTPRSLLPSMVITGFGMGFTFAPMTAAAMRDVPLRIAGSASGILNTTRNIGQVLGIAILGSWLQNRLGVFSEEQLASTSLDSETATQVTELAQQNQFPDIEAMLPADQFAQVFDALQEAFVQAVQSTFFIGALACGVAAAAALMIRNPTPRPVELERHPAPELRQPGLADH